MKPPVHGTTCNKTYIQMAEWHMQLPSSWFFCNNNSTDMLVFFMQYSHIKKIVQNKMCTEYLTVLSRRYVYTAPILNNHYNLFKVLISQE